MLKQFYDKLKAYPVILMFFVFLFSFAVFDAIYPKRAFSELENRPLAQNPPINFADIATNKWMIDYEKYVKDQIIFRDSWIDIKSRCEGMVLKTENNGVWYGKDNMLFQKLISINNKQLLKNTKFLSDFALQHEGMVSVMIVPSASLIYNDKLPFAAPMADENAALDEIFSELTNNNATVYDLRKTFTAHKDDGLYFRNDHHWNANGAYLAYSEYAAHNNLVLFDMQNHKVNKIEKFYGTNYSKSRYPKAVADDILFYELPYTIDIHKLDAANTVTNMPIYNEEKWQTRDKYGAYLQGNNGYSTINGSGSGNVLIVKDSYANSFIPFLTENYAKIGIVDLRDTKMSIDELISKEKYEKVLFLYNFETFSEDNNIWKIKEF
ncbi:MAG: DHHW family protein [Oscillospiraceae bacterium]